MAAGSISRHGNQAEDANPLPYHPMAENAGSYHPRTWMVAVPLNQLRCCAAGPFAIVRRFGRPMIGTF